MILITGATGFIGRRVLQSLIRKVGASNVSMLVFEPDLEFTDVYPGIRVTHGSLSDRSKLAQAMEGVDVILHLASKTIDRDGTGFDEANVEGTRNLCDVAVGNGVRKVVYLSSVGVYGHRSFRDADETTPLCPDTAYSRSKLAAEEIVLGHHRSGRLQGIIVRTRFVYGEGDVNVLARLTKLAKKSRFVIDQGRAMLSFILVDDLAEIVTRFALQQIPWDSDPVYHATDGSPVSYREMMYTICDVFGHRRPTLSIPFWLLYYPIRCAEVLLRIDPEVAHFPLTSIRLKLLGRDNSFSNKKIHALLPELEFVPFGESFRKLAGYYSKFL